MKDSTETHHSPSKHPIPTRANDKLKATACNPTLGCRGLFFPERLVAPRMEVRQDAREITSRGTQIYDCKGHPRESVSCAAHPALLVQRDFVVVVHKVVNDDHPPRDVLHAQTSNTPLNLRRQVVLGRRLVLAKISQQCLFLGPVWRQTFVGPPTGPRTKTLLRFIAGGIPPPLPRLQAPLLVEPELHATTHHGAREHC